MPRGVVRAPSSLRTKRDVRCFQPGNPDNARPQCWSGVLKFDPKAELALFDSVAAEHAEISGTPVEIWLMETDPATADPLYNEPVNRLFTGPFGMTGVFGYPDGAPTQNPEGSEMTWPSTLWIARIALETVGCRIPGEGDIIRVWDIPVQNDQAAGLDASPERTVIESDPIHTSPFRVEETGYYFNITDADTDAYLFDGPYFVGVNLTLARNTVFRPERRMETIQKVPYGRIL